MAFAMAHPRYGYSRWRIDWSGVGSSCKDGEGMDNGEKPADVQVRIAECGGAIYHFGFFEIQNEIGKSVIVVADSIS